MDAPRTPLIRVRKGNTLLLNSTHLRYELPHQNRLLIRKSYGGRIDLQTTIRLESERLLLRSKPCALSRVFLLSSGGKSVLLMKKKAPSHMWCSCIYVRSLKDQARKSQYPRT